MFSDFAISLYIAVGFSAWFYVKMQRRTGGNTTNSVIVTAGLAAVVFVIIYTILGIVF